MSARIAGWLLLAAAVGCSGARRDDAENGLGGASGVGETAGSGAGTNAAGSGGAGTGIATGDAGITPIADAGSDDASLGTDAATIDDVLPERPAFACGEHGIVLEDHGPPQNRLNYIIVGDGYTSAELDTVYQAHLQTMLGERFTPELEPYARYRGFVNICALRTPSNVSGITTAPRDTAFSGYGNDDTRLGYIDDDKVQDAIDALLPAEIEVDWTAIVLNDDRWWNAGGRFMVWSGGHTDAALAAEHEGGHSFQRLADEYGGNCTFSGNGSNLRVNVALDPVTTNGKWSEWLGFDHTPGTGVQGAFEGGQYCDKGIYRPSDASVMNILWDSPYFNAISREAAIRVIYDVVRPIDAASPDTQSAPGVFFVQLVDDAVLKVDWSIDGALVAEDGGQVFDVSKHSLASGSHELSARAYDDTPWVRGDRSALEESRSWTVVVP